jgi:hypothetical protein
MLLSPTLFEIAHPPGEPPSTPAPGQGDTFPITTAGGVFQVQYLPDARVSAQGGMVPFAHFLEVSKVFTEWVEDSPLEYASNRAHTPTDVLGTMLLSILNGHYRFAHVTALRGDTVTPGLLGMKHVVSEDSVRRALLRLVKETADREKTMSWLRRQLVKTVRPLLTAEWVMDIDVTIKPVYGFQEGSVVGYNPAKPGRPCHALHTFVMAKTRLVLEVAVHPGNEHTSKSTIPDFQSVLVDLPRALWPKVVRADCAYGTEDMMAWPEANQLDFLFKMRKTAGVNAKIDDLELTQGWVDAGQGWQGKSSTLQLSSWTRARRVVVLRRPDPGPRYQRAKDLEPKKEDSKQQVIAECEPFLVADGFEYTVLVTSLTDDIPFIAQLYRDRADVENVFDEIKNHWGWGGFTSRTFAVTQAVARIVAIIYNWWSIFVRIADPNHHREAITTRPMLLNGVVKLTTSGGQRLLTITSTNGKKHAIANFFSRLSAWLTKFTTTAEQWSSDERWGRLMSCIFARLLGTSRPIIA